MDKGKSKTDLRAAGKKRLEEFRQKRQQKGSSIKTSTSTALKALSESEQNPGEKVGEEILRGDSISNEEPQRTTSGKDRKAELVSDHAGQDGNVHEEQRASTVVDPPPESFGASSIQRLKLGGHLVPETSEQSVDSPCDPGSSSGNLDDKDREAVYTILWENHGIDHHQRNEEWQESSFDVRADLAERALDQGNYSTFRVDDEHYGTETKETPRSQRRLSGTFVDAIDRFQSSEDEAAEDDKRDSLSVDQSHKAHSSFTKDESTEERTPPEWDENLEKEKVRMAAEVALMHQKLEKVMEDTRRERELQDNEIGLWKSQVREKEEAVCARDVQLQELEADKHQSEQNLRTALDRIEKEKEQSNLDLMEVKSEVERLNEERGGFLSRIEVYEKELEALRKEKEQSNLDLMEVKSEVERLNEERGRFLSRIEVYEKELEALRRESAELVVQMNYVSEEKNLLAANLSAANEQAAESLKHQEQLLSSLKELEHERETETTRYRELGLHLEGVITEKVQLEVRLSESANALEELRVNNIQLSNDLAISEGQRLALTEENKSKSDRIGIMEDERLRYHELIENIKQRLSMHEEKEKVTAALDVQVKNFEAECKRLQFLVETLRTSLQSLEDEKAELACKFSDLQAEKEELIAQVEIAKNELIVEQSQLESSRTQQAEIVKELENTKLEVIKVLADKNKVQLDLEECKQKLEHLMDQFGKLIVERTQMEEFLGQKLQTLEDNIEVLSEEKLKLEEQLAGAKHELEQLNGQLRKADVERVEMRETAALGIKTLEQQLWGLENERTKLEELFRTVSTELQLSNDKINKLTVEKVGNDELLGQKLQNLENNVRILSEEKVNLEAQLTGAKCELEQLNEQLKNADVERIKMKESSAVVVETLEQQIRGLGGERTEFEMQLQTLRAEIHLLNEKIIQNAAERVEMEIDAETLNQKVTDLENRTSELDQGFNVLIEEKGRMVSDHASLQQILEKTREEKMQLESDLLLIQEDLLKLKDEKAQVESDREISLQKLNDTSIKEEVLVNQLKESQDALEKVSDESRSLKLELSSVARKLYESVASNEKLVGDVQSLQERLQAAEEMKSHIEIELKESFAELNDSTQDKTSLNNQLNSLLQNVQVLENEKLELQSRAQQLQESVKQKEEEMVLCKEEWRQHEVNSSAKEELEDFGNVSPGSHAANIKLVKKLVEVFEGKVSDDILIQNQRGLSSPVSEFFIQAQAMKKTSDDLQRERDAAVQAESTLRADLVELRKQFHDLSEERVRLQTQVTELQEELAIAIADCRNLNHNIERLRDEAEQGVKMVAILERDKCALQAETLELVEKLRAAEETVLEDRALKQTLQGRSEELEAKLQAERDVLEKMLSRLNILTIYIEEHVFTYVPELVWTSDAADIVSQVEYKVTLVVNRVLPGLIAKSNTLEEERDLARTALYNMTDDNNMLQVERNGLISEKEVLKAEIERMMISETEARGEYEEQVKVLISSLEEAENRLQSVKNDCTDFEKKLQVALNQGFPDHDVEPPGTPMNTLGVCWFLVETMLEISSKKLQDVRTEFSHASSEFDNLLAEERLQHQARVEDVKADREVLRQKVEELSEKVKLLEEERTLLHEEQKRVSHEFRAQLEIEAKSNEFSREKIQVLESNVYSLQNDLKETKAEDIEVRRAFERDINLLKSTFEAAQTELDKVKESHVRFDEKLECAARVVLPNIDIKPVDFEDNLFDYSWAVVNLILEEYSQKLQNVQLEATEVQSRVNIDREREFQSLQEQVRSITAELGVAKEEKRVAQSELAQSEKRLATSKERLTLAINKGKSIVVQRDAVKAALAEKTAELQRVESDLKEVIKVKDIALQEAEAAAISLKAIADQADILKAKLVENHEISAKLEKSLSETISALRNLETMIDEITSGADDAAQTRVAKLEWVGATLKDLKMRLSYLEGKAESLIMDLSTVSNEKEVVVQKLHDATLKCNQLEQVIEEDALNVVALKSKIESLEETVVVMKAEASLHINLQHHVSRAIGMLESSGQDLEADPDLSNESELLAATTSFVNKYKAVVHESEELRKRCSFLSDALDKSDEEKSLTSGVKLQSLEEMLQSRDLELKDMMLRLEDANRVISDKSSEIEAYMQSDQRLSEDLVKSKEELGTVEQKMKVLKNELHEVVTSFNTPWEERDSQAEVVAHSVCETITEVESLMKTVVEHVQRRESEVQDANEKAMAALMLDSHASKELVAKLEEEFLECKTVAQEITWLTGPPPSSSSLLDWVTCLNGALEEEHQKVERASEEIEALTKTTEEKAFQVQKLEGKVESLSAEVCKGQQEKESVVDELRKTEVELQRKKDELEILAAKNVGLESEMKSVRTMLQVQNALMGFEDVVEHVRLQGGPSSIASPTEWISWLIQAFRDNQNVLTEAQQQLETLKSTSTMISLQVEEVNAKYSSACEELSDEKNKNEILQFKLRELHETFAVERDSLKAENQVLKDSCVKVSSRDFEFSEAQRTATNLQETLISKEKQFSELHNEIEDLLSRYVEQELKLQSLIEEKEGLNSELVKVEAERNSLRIELANEKSTAQSDVTQLEQKLVVVREKLSLAIKKGKGLEKQRDSLKQSLAEETAKIKVLEQQLGSWKELLDEEAGKCQGLKEQRDSLMQSLTEETAKGKVLEDQLDSLKQSLDEEVGKGRVLKEQLNPLKRSLAEETAKVESIIVSYTNEIQIRDAELLESRAHAKALVEQVHELREKATLSQKLSEIEREKLQSALSRIEIPSNVLSKVTVEKVEWLVSLLEDTRNTADYLEVELGDSKSALETLKTVLTDTEERLQSVTVEYLKAEDTNSTWVKKLEELESRTAFDRKQHEDEVDSLTRALKEADMRQQAASSRVRELEKLVEKQQNTITASEVARSKSASKLAFTRNKLNLLVQQSQELVRECENLHKSLQERNAEIVELNLEISRLKNIIQDEQSQRMGIGSMASSQLTLLQEELARTSEKSAAIVKELREQHVTLKRIVEEKDDEIRGVQKKLLEILVYGDSVAWMEHTITNQHKGDDILVEGDARNVNGDLDLASVITVIGQRFETLVAGAHAWKNSFEKKDAQLQKLKNELYNVTMEKASLHADILAKTKEIERLQSEISTKDIPVGGSPSSQFEIEELETRSNRIGLKIPVTPQVRSSRRQSQSEIAIDMDEGDDSYLLSDMDDKGHGFSALSNSRLVPKATRLLADKLDGLWFAGGRILTRQPSARLGLATYWILIHVYVAMCFFSHFVTHS